VSATATTVARIRDGRYQPRPMALDPCGVATGYTTPELVDEPHQKVGLLACLRTNPTHRKAKVRFALDVP
jgi:hypothetical protein